tara:strand:+ start:1957 stop:2334 length:378 start_codon:yes stop_codon:yes gene_type:complete
MKMKVKENNIWDYALLIFIVLIITCLLYPMYTNSEKENYSESLKNKINKLEKESSNKDIKILKLKNSLLETESELSAMNEEVKRLSDENGLFTSMFTGIESEPGGHEILKKLFNELNPKSLETKK